MKKRLFLLLGLLFFSFSQVSALGDSIESNLSVAQQKESSEQTNSFQQDYNQSNSQTMSLVNSSQTQETNSSQQILPQKTAREYLESAKKELEELKAALMESNNGLESMKIQLNSCLQNLENCEKALQSNKEDTSVAIQELGNLYTEYQALQELVALSQKRLNHAYVAGNVIIPTIAIPLVIVGSILTYENNDYGKPVLYSSLGILGGAMLVWNSGHLIFKVW